MSCVQTREVATSYSDEAAGAEPSWGENIVPFLCLQPLSWFCCRNVDDFSGIFRSRSTESPEESVRTPQGTR